VPTVCGRQYAIEGRTAAAIYVDHVKPHPGQRPHFFKYENTQSLCAHQHTCISNKKSAATLLRAERTHQHLINHPRVRHFSGGKREGKGARLDSVVGLVTMGTGGAGL